MNHKPISTTVTDRNEPRGEEVGGSDTAILSYCISVIHLYSREAQLSVMYHTLDLKNPVSQREGSLLLEFRHIYDADMTENRSFGRRDILMFARLFTPPMLVSYFTST